MSTITKELKENAAELLRSQAGRQLNDRMMKVELGDAVCVVSPISARVYYQFVKNSIPIDDDPMCDFLLHNRLQREAPDFDLPRIYASLRVLFGESTTMYDDYKCSFGYPFLLSISKEGREFGYVMLFTDLKGGINFKFNKLPDSRDDLPGGCERRMLHEPMEDFPKNKIEYFMAWFVFYLAGYSESLGNRCVEEFARSQDYCFMLYGYRDGGFFSVQYEDYDEFRAARHEMSRDGGTPFNRVKPNW
jgi:hypothetical protein